MPCYNLLESLIPESRPLKEGVQQNLERWKGLADEQQAIKDAAAAELETNEKSATAAVNGESEQNGTSDPPSTRISPKKRIQKQDSLSVPVNPANNDSK